MIRRLITLTLGCMFGLGLPAASEAAVTAMEQKALDLLATCDVQWDSPSENSWGSMPLGNGDIGVNFWVEPDGDMVFYISKTDAWSNYGQLLKLGRIRMKFEPSPVGPGKTFAQVLRLENGEITVEAGTPQERLHVRLWIDAHHPVIQFEAQSVRPVTLQTDVELWRTEKRELTKEETSCFYDGRTKHMVEPDIVMQRTGELLWCHRNENSDWDHLAIDKYPELNIPPRPDPFKHRTFGCLAKGEGLKNISDRSLRSERPAQHFTVAINALTAQTDTLDQWAAQIYGLAQKIEPLDIHQRRQAHQQWWRDFWTRSWIFIDGDEKAKAVTRGYALQRFMNACAGRGAHPIKFNGSIFTMDLEPGQVHSAAGRISQGIDADFRLWGGMYWFQNTRLIYWTMLPAGDFDLMPPFFKMYHDMLPLAIGRTRIHYGHPGAHYLEVNPWHGPALSVPPMKDPSFTTYYWQGGLELSAMMLDYFDMTRDEAFLQNTALPVIREILAFYEHHYPRDEKGKLRMEPAQALETYWEVINPTPEVAGLDYITERLLTLPTALSSDSERQNWRDWRKVLPDYATRKLNGIEVISPAGTLIKDERPNMENPEMYAIFPYRRFGLGRDRLDLALRTYENRIEKRTGGWFYDSIMAAMLGLGEEAAKVVHRNFTVANAIDPTNAPSPFPCRFPNFLGPNYDWVPDQDQPSVAMIALQRMVLQEVDSRLLVLPAWPAEWNVFFKLHGGQRTTLLGECRDGKMITLKIDPESRKNDIIFSGMTPPKTNAR